MAMHITTVRFLPSFLISLALHMLFVLYKHQNSPAVIVQEKIPIRLTETSSAKVAPTTVVQNVIPQKPIRQPEPIAKAVKKTTATTAPMVQPDASTTPQVAENGNDHITSEGMRHAADAREHYLAEIRAIIAKKQVYPRASRKMGEEGTVKLKFIVHGNGRIEGPFVAAPSKHGRLDAAAVEAAEEALPHLPSPPTILQNKRLALTVPVTFRLQ